MCSAARWSPRPADSTPLGEDSDSEFGDLIEDSEAIQPGEAVSFTLLHANGDSRQLAYCQLLGCERWRVRRSRQCCRYGHGARHQEPRRRHTERARQYMACVHRNDEVSRL